MNRGQIKNTFFGLALAAALAIPGLAGDCRKKTELQPTGAGMANDISGKAEVRARGQRQRFKLSMDARVPDGTTFVVLVNGSAVGTATVDFGNAELELDSGDGAVLPTSLGDVCTVGMVSVTDGGGQPVLQGNF